MPVFALIPAHRPDPCLPGIVEELSQSPRFSGVVIVDDGSGEPFRRIFAELSAINGVTVVEHRENLGKGAALKTGLRYLLDHHPDLTGVVTADADGQHAVEDIAQVAAELDAHPEALICGVRTFSGPVPLRSRLGNAVTRSLFRILTGHALSDTQTGLRGLPRPLLDGLLEIAADHYEFELDMLLLAARRRIPIRETPISTLYFEDNRSSHFNPLLDSIRIYFVLFRFGLASLMTAVIDNCVFLLFYRAHGSIAGSQALARLAAILFNYYVVRNSVFRSTEANSRVFPRYIALVAVSGLASYALLTALNRTLGMPPFYAKLTAESLLFLVNFVVQRNAVFRAGEPASPVVGS